MGFTELLTIVFVVLKLIGIIEWSWFFVLLPEIIALVIYCAIIIFDFSIIHKTNKTINKAFDKEDWRF